MQPRLYTKYIEEQKTRLEKEANELMSSSAKKLERLSTSQKESMKQNDPFEKLSSMNLHI